MKASLTFLGIEIDTLAMELRLPKDKLDRINREIASWKEKRSCTKRELQSLTGQLQHAATVVRPGRTFIRWLYDMIAATRSAHHHVRLNIEARSDIAWWSTFLLSWNGVSMLTPGLRQSPQHVVTSDASGHWGCGAYCMAEWFQLSWQGTPLANASIAVKELVPLVVAAALWGRQWSGSTVMCKCDNQAVVAVIGSRTSSDKQIMHMLRWLFFLEASFDYHLDWCAGMVVLPKSDGRVRICVDLTRLNQSVCRERRPLPAVEQTLAQLAGARVFTKLDANSGFWQIPLSPNSALLTTFLTPYGRYCFHRLPFGITSAPEHFQRRMSVLLDGMEGIVCLMDDILVYGRTQEHDDRLLKVLRRLEAAGLTLNRDKCEFSKSQVKFLGQIIDQTVVRPDLLSLMSELCTCK